MHTVEERLSSWVDVVGHLLRERLAEFPHRFLLEQCDHTFEAHPSWIRVNADGTFGFELLRPPANWPPPDELEYWRNGGLQRHPLIRWYAETKVADPQTIGRVPMAVSGPADRAMVVDQLRPVGLEEQLSLPYRFTREWHASFVLARSGDDFSDDDLEVARRIQPLLYLLDRQVSLRASHPDIRRAGRAGGLTEREIAVVRLLADGHTATAIAHRLGSSTRTVHKHLEHVYRKIGVRDRLTAVRWAREQGLLDVS